MNSEARLKFGAQTAPHRQMLGLRPAARQIWRFARRKPLGAVGGLLILLVAVLSFGASIFAPYDPLAIDATNYLGGPSLEHLAGVDTLGRDTFSRTLYGGQTSLAIGFGAVIVGLTVSATIGTISGYAGGWVDLFLQRIVDAFQGLPTIVLLLMVATVLGSSTVNLIVIIGVINGVSSSRIIRGATLSLREQDFLVAARCLGAPAYRIVFRHILPNLFAPLMIVGSLALASAILSEASVSFLGFGIQPPGMSWGTLIGVEGRAYMAQQPGLVAAPGLALAVVVFGINVLGDALRDVLDPRLRSS